MSIHNILIHHKHATHKFLTAWKIEQLNETKVVSCGNYVSSVADVSTVDVSVVAVLRPDANDVITQNTEKYF